MNPKLKVNLSKEVLSSALLEASAEHEKEKKRMRAITFCHILSDMMAGRRLAPRLTKEEVFNLIHCDPAYQDAIWVRYKKYSSDEELSDKMMKLYEEYEDWVMNDKLRRSLLYATKKI